MANEEEELQDLANSVIKSDAYENPYKAVWIKCHTNFAIQWYAKWYLANYNVPEKKKVVILAFLMGLPVEQGPNKNFMFGSLDPHWWDTTLKFRIKTNEPQD